ncbi:MAG: cupin domain-containing protein [Mariniblastus sp.]
MKYFIVIFLACVSIGHHDDHGFHDTGIEIKELVKSTESWNGKLLPAYPKGQPEVTILKITVPPKTKLAMHRHPYINAGVLLKGELNVVTDDHRKLKLKAGDSIVEIVNQLHFGENAMDEPAEIIVFYAGVKDRPVTIKQESASVEEK